jgi:hypothetical protein
MLSKRISAHCLFFVFGCEHIFIAEKTFVTLHSFVQFELHEPTLVPFFQFIFLSTPRINGLNGEAFGTLTGPMRHAMDLGYLKEVGLKVGKIIGIR